jgi:Sulfotransferase family
MIIVIVEFQGIHEARMHHLKLLSLLEQEQTSFNTVENEFMTVVRQAGESLTGQHFDTPPLLSEGHSDDPIEQEIVGNIATMKKKSTTLSSLSYNSKNQLIDQPIESEVVVTTKPALRTTSQWNLPESDTNHGRIPHSLSNLADLSTPYFKKRKELPFFWHIAKSGGTSLKHMYSDCYDLVLACESGIAEGHARDITLKVITLESGWKFLNVDTTTPAGIERASRFNVVRSGKADMIVSPLPPELVSKVFVQETRGRCFVVVRDPIDRVVSLFYYLQNASHEPTYNPALKKMNLEEYVQSDLAESNFMVRSLLGKMEAPLSEEDFHIASEILRTKCIIGLLDELVESVRRFDLYFGFGLPKKPDPTCTEKYLHAGTNRHSHPTVPHKDSTTYQRLRVINHMDVRLYQYAQKLFSEQAAIFQKTQQMNTN